MSPVPAALSSPSSSPSSSSSSTSPSLSSVFDISRYRYRYISSAIEDEQGAGATFPSTQIGSGPRWQLQGTSVPNHPPAAAASPATAAADLGTCKTLGPSWFDILMRMDDACVCSAVTPQGHLQYGGLDLVYHRALAPWDKPAPCRLENGQAGNVHAFNSIRCPHLKRRLLRLHSTCFISLTDIPCVIVGPQTFRRFFNIYNGSRSHCTTSDEKPHSSLSL